MDRWNLKFIVLLENVFTYTKLGLSGDIHFRSRTLGYSRTDDLVQDVLFLFFHWSREILCNFLILILIICYFFYCCIHTNYWNIVCCTPKRSIHLLLHFLKNTFRWKLFYFLLSSPYLDRHEGCNSCPFAQLHAQVYQRFVPVSLVQCTQHLSKFYNMQLLNSFEAFTTKFLPLSGSRTFSTRFGARRPRRPGFPASQTHPVKSKFNFSEPVLPDLTFLEHN